MSSNDIRDADAPRPAGHVEDGVFPYWSLSNSPASYAYAGGVYALRAQAAGATDGYYLAPEWDESRSAYYVRLVESSTAKYGFAHASREIRPYVSLNDVGIVIQDAGSAPRRVLKWRDDGGGVRLLVLEHEQEAEDRNASTASSSSSLGLFKFARDDSVALACPRIANARCQAYNIVSSSSSGGPVELGISACERNGAVYLTLAPDNLVPFTLIDAAAAAASSTDHAL